MTRRRHTLTAVVIGVVIAAAGVRVQQTESPQPPSLEQLRRSAIDAFIGPQAYDETARLAVRDRIDERTVLAPCRSVQFVHNVSLSRFKQSGFDEVAVQTKYPEYALHLVRDLPAPKRLDIVLFYFRVSKQSGLNCSFLLGMIGRRETANGRVLDDQRDALYKDAKTVRDAVEAQIARSVQ